MTVKKILLAVTLLAPLMAIANVDGRWDGIEGHPHEFDMGPGGLGWDYNAHDDHATPGTCGGWKDCSLQDGPTVPKEFVISMAEDGHPEEPKIEL